MCCVTRDRMASSTYPNFKACAWPRLSRKLRANCPRCARWSHSRTGIRSAPAAHRLSPRPKGAVLHHRGVVNSARVYVDALNAHGAVQVCGMPLFHIVGCGLTVLGTIASAGSLVLMPYFDPGLLIRLLEEERGECFFGVPTMLIACLEHPSLADT